MELRFYKNRMGEKQKILAKNETNNLSLNRKIVIATAVFVVLLFSLVLSVNKFGITGFLSKEIDSGEVTEDYDDAFYYAELTRPIMESNIAVGLLSGRPGNISTECCIDHAGKTKLKHKFLGVENRTFTIHLFEKEKYGKIGSKQFEEIKNLSRKYIKKVYICIPKNSKVREELIPYFGDKTITKSSCNYDWIEESCCQDWQMP